ncbi:MAG: tyrosine-protein phosphatase [Desulfobacterales bacterium]
MTRAIKGITEGPIHNGGNSNEGGSFSNNRFGVGFLNPFGGPAFHESSAGGPSAGTLPQLAPGQSLGIALGIPTVANLRDVGGYETRDGATVARGLAYRSDTFNPMTAADIKKLERLALKNDYDLRTTAEVKAKPDEMPPGVHYHLLNVLADAKSAAPAELEALLHEPKKANVALGGGRIEALFMEGYREFIFLPSAKQSYRTLFLSLVEKQMAPGVFHCTTGKDRTGWAAAALLTLLGVPNETGMADYMRTNEYTLPQFKHVIDDFVAAGGDRAIALAIFGVKPEYLEASFEEMHKQYGTIERYFSKALGIDAAGQKVLRDLFLERK